MKTQIQPKQLELFVGTSFELQSKKFSGRLQMVNLLRQQLVSKYAYASGKVSAPLEFRIAYAELMVLLPKSERKSARIQIGVGKGAHYNWLKDAQAFSEGKLEVRTYVKRIA